METLSDEDVLLSLTQVLRRVTGTERVWPGTAGAPRWPSLDRSPALQERAWCSDPPGTVLLLRVGSLSSYV